MRERWPLSIVGEGLRPARLAPPQVWAELPLKRCHAQAVRAAMLLRLRQEPPTTRAAVIRDPSNNFRNWPVVRNPGGDIVTRGGVDAGRYRGQDQVEKINSLFSVLRERLALLRGLPSARPHPACKDVGMLLESD